VRSGQNLLLFSVIVELSLLSLIKFDILLSLISELMVTYLDDRKVNTCNGWAEAENSQANGNPPPPPTLAQAIASILESRDEQMELLWQLVANSAHGGNRARNAPAPALTTYSDFVTTHPRSSSRQESLLRPTIGFMQLSPSLVSYTVRRCRRLFAA
jgi:hypothetical protein